MEKITKTLIVYRHSKNFAKFRNLKRFSQRGCNEITNNELTAHVLNPLINCELSIGKINIRYKNCIFYSNKNCIIYQNKNSFNQCGLIMKQNKDLISHVETIGEK